MGLWRLVPGRLSLWAAKAAHHPSRTFTVSALGCRHLESHGVGIVLSSDRLCAAVSGRPQSFLRILFGAR